MINENIMLPSTVSMQKSLLSIVYFVDKTFDKRCYPKFSIVTCPLELQHTTLYNV